LDFQLSEEQKRLKKEWEEFFSEWAKKAPKAWHGTHGSDTTHIYGDDIDKEMHPYAVALYKAQLERGYITEHWPKEYGGKEVGSVEQVILGEIKNYYRIPQHNGMGLNLLAPTLMAFGTPEQKKEYIPKIVSGEIQAAQVWSEPNAGSDLAALTTRAVRQGDYYVVNGQKTWISGIGGCADAGNWGHSPMRTDPDSSKRHRGLTYFMYPLDLPGITVRDLYASNGNRGWGEVFFEDVKIPIKYRIGEENKGWYVTMATANFERSGGPFGELIRDVEELVDYCLKTERGGKKLIENPQIREELASFAVEADKLRAINYRAAWEQRKGTEITAFASANKIIWTELALKINNFVANRLGGLQGMMRRGSKWTLFDGFWEIFGEQVTIGKITNIGTNDIQHNVIANRGLQLPRDGK